MSMYNPKNFAHLVSAIQPKLDSLGRRNARVGGRPKSALFTKYFMVRVDEETYNLMRAKFGPKGISAKVRDYIEWGMENDE